MNSVDNASSSAADAPSGSDFLQLGLCVTASSWTPPPPAPLLPHDMDASLKILSHPSKSTLRLPNTSAAFISECLAKNQGKEKPDDDRAQLTIFYGGAVHVYDNVPSHKAQALMVLVKSQQNGDNSIATIHAKQSPSLNPLSIQDMTPTNRRSHRELPFARKASFARFLKTRKTRVQEAMMLKEAIKEEALQKASDL